MVYSTEVPLSVYGKHYKTEKRYTPKKLHSHFYYICAALREIGKRHVPTDVTPGICMMYISQCFATQNTFLTFEILIG